MVLDKVKVVPFIAVITVLGLDQPLISIFAPIKIDVVGTALNTIVADPPSTLAVIGVGVIELPSI